MNLCELSLKLTGKSTRRETIELFFPNIPSWNRNILGINIKSNNISSTLSTISNFGCPKNLRDNSINTTLVDNLIEFSKNGNNLNNLLEVHTNALEDIEYFTSQNHIPIIDCFQYCITLIDENGLISKEHLDIINTY